MKSFFFFLQYFHLSHQDLPYIFTNTFDDLSVLLLLLFLYIVYTTKCERARLEALANGPLLGQFVPHCRDDGSYEPAQCWASTGYCWCVDQNGERKADSMVRFKHPICL